MLLLLLPPLLQTHRTAVLMRTTGYFAGQSTAVVVTKEDRCYTAAHYLLCQCATRLMYVGAGDGHDDGW